VYGAYDGYHNSNDDKAFMGIASLVESAEQIERVLRSFEYAGRYENQKPYGEPMLGKRDLYPNVNGPQRWSHTEGTVDEKEFLDRILTVLNYSDGERTMVDIATEYGCPVDGLIPVVDTLEDHGLLKRKDAD
jgi:aminopeptidase-like protein